LGEEGGLKPSEWECSPSKANSEGHLLWERGVMPLEWGVPKVSATGEEEGVNTDFRNVQDKVTKG